MKKLLLLFLLFLFSKDNSAQIRRDAVWCFGDSVMLDFNTGPTISSCSARTRGTACSITDSSGNLLFYAHTFYIPYWQAGYSQLGIIWNRNNQIMENGDSLIGDGWYYEMVIIPNPADNNQYYLFHTSVTLDVGIYYSIIDMSYNGGLGKVIQKNILLDNLSGDQPTDGLAAIKHGNGRDWWLVFKAWISTNNKVHKFLITPSGVSSDQIQNIGTLTYYNLIRLRFNHRGNKLLVTSASGLLEYYDFDRCTGMLSNRIQINAAVFQHGYDYWDAEFSPNDSVLYISQHDTLSSLIQYDLSASNISATKQTIHSFNFPLYGATGIRAAIDGKIYWNISYYDGINFNYPYPDSVHNVYNENLSVINQPNYLGVACDLQLYSFYLGGRRTYAGLPNNPNYDMEAWGGSICDTLGLPNEIIASPQSTKAEVSVYYHLGWEMLFINSRGLSGKNYFLKIFDSTGKLVFSEEGKLYSQYFTRDLQFQFAKGLFIVTLGSENEIISKKIIKE